MPIEEEEEGNELIGKDRERRRAAARQGFESTWLGKSRMGAPGGGQNTAQNTQQQRPQTVLRKNMGA
jgi:hypothetical protein